MYGYCNKKVLITSPGEVPRKTLSEVLAYVIDGLSSENVAKRGPMEVQVVPQIATTRVVLPLVINFLPLIFSRNRSRGCEACDSVVSIVLVSRRLFPGVRDHLADLLWLKKK